MKTTKLALVTGASSGIGAAFAWAYAKRGFDVALVGRRIDLLEKISSAISTSHDVVTIPIRADLSDPDAHLQILAELRMRSRAVDVLVNNAGYGIAEPFAETIWTVQRNFLFVSIVNLCGLTYGVLPEMIAQGVGAVINVSSIVALSPDMPGYTLYPAAKSFVLKFSRSLRREVRHAGISVTAVCPGYTPTEFHQVNGTEHLNRAAPRRFSTNSEAVVEATISANRRGKATVIPGWHNKLAAWAFRYLPDPMTEPVVHALSAKYRLPSEPSQKDRGRQAKDGGHNS